MFKLLSLDWAQYLSKNDLCDKKLIYHNIWEEKEQIAESGGGHLFWMTFAHNIIKCFLNSVPKIGHLFSSFSWKTWQISKILIFQLFFNCHFYRDLRPQWPSSAQFLALWNWMSEMVRPIHPKHGQRGDWQNG